MHFDNIDKMFNAAIGDCWFSGHSLKSRDGGCAEVIGWDGYLDDPTKCFLWNPHRKFNPSYAAGELFWYLAGTDDGEFIKHYAPSYDRFLEDDGNANGAYGARWKEHGGLQTLVRLLEQDPNTRQAILAMWGPRDLRSAHAHDKRDIPCTLSLQFFVRRKRLYCICTMRSNDVWLGMPNDVFAFCQLQCLIADYLGLEIGWYRHQVGSMHLYLRNSEKAKLALEWCDAVEEIEPEVLLPQTTGSFVFSEALKNTLTLEQFARVENINKFTNCIEMVRRERFTVLATLAACTSLRRSGVQTPTEYGEILGKETLEACKVDYRRR